MTQPHPEETLALIVATPDHRLDCFRLIRPGRNYYQGNGNTVLCPTCCGNLLIGEDSQALTTTSGLIVDYGGGLIRIRREGATIEVKTRAVRHLVDALVEAAVGLV